MAKGKLLKTYEKEHFKRDVIIRDREKVIVEGCRKIVLVDSERMIFEGGCRVEISGENLRLLEMGNDNIGATGRINAVVFGDANEK